ncbi:MAG: general secretion pathway protein GspB [Candidatus Omnitrophota bacterium]
MNTNKIAMSAAMMIAAGSALFINISIASGQDAPPQPEGPDTANVSYTSMRLRDPFLPCVRKEMVSVAELQDTAAAALPPLTISGITWGSSFAQAIVNGKVVRAGDMIDDVKVVSISKEGLVLLYNSQQVTIPAPGASSVKR